MTSIKSAVKSDQFRLSYKYHNNKTFELMNEWMNELIN